MRTHPNGLPAYVPPSSPGADSFIISLRPMTPLIGTPAPNDLDTVIKSGTTS